MIGYKVFDKDLKCRDFQYKVGEVFKLEDKFEIREKGFHFCEMLVDCFSYYSFNPENRVCKVIALGAVDIDDDKMVTDEIFIEKELTWFEVLNLVNSGNNNSGYNNSGDYNKGNHNSGIYNSGDYNSGDYNSGDYNSGYYNSGDHNSGYYNSGDSNSGDYNKGNYNSGDSNIGDYNSGNRSSGHNNSGDINSGNRNSGYCNNGDSNSGNYNSGDNNSGHYSSGHYNSGHHNSGHYNSGHNNSGVCNSGNHNSCNFESGHFNSVEPEYIRVFNKPCKRDVWDSAFKPSFLYFSLTEWIPDNKMSEEEKLKYPNYETSNGYLKTLSYKEAFQESFKKATKEDIEQLKKLPNFDADVFFEISGIRIK